MSCNAGVNHHLAQRVRAVIVDTRSPIAPAQIPNAHSNSKPPLIRNFA
jgi:hypothetical protein